MKKYLIPIALGAIGVVAGGLLLKFGRDNDVPLFKEASEGFDH